MRKMIILFIAFLIATGCSPEAKTRDEPSVQKETSAVTEDYMETLPAAIQAAASAKEAVAIFESNLPILSPDQLDRILMELEDYCRANREEVEEALSEANEANTFGTLRNPVSLESISGFADEGVKKAVTDAIAGKYKFVAGEGVIVPMLDYRALVEYKAYLTPAMGEYLELMAIESDNPARGDGSIIIPWEQLGKRALNIEEYLNEYPMSPRYDRVKGEYLSVISSFFMGASNSNMYNPERELEPKIQASYNALIASFPDTYTGELTKEYVEFVLRAAKDIPKADNSNDDPFYEELMKFKDAIEGRVLEHFQGKNSAD
ncbi:hypothetical protein [Cohnella lupini]|uniref:Lipoprotein n=1 Tax=Cohnella lupini TaxID=1294267 RepID=A0A3D9IF92_9BACL|nr:hypothetical protein [Cohnella lupini]RED60219.1 hypothetical protein DFP95_1068 [Cohnella lupini]